MIRLILKAFDLLAWFVRLCGADCQQFRAILEAKVTLDFRRQMGGIHRADTKKSRQPFLWALFGHAIFGCITLIILFFVPADVPLLGMTALHSFLMCVMGISLVADFTNVLMDTTELTIINPRPVSARTMYAARVAHTCTYLGLLGISFSLAPAIGGALLYHPFFPPVFLATLLLSLCFLVFAVNLFYFVAMCVVSLEKFRDIILYAQMAMMIVMMGGYQLLPRLVDFRALRQWDLSSEWWVYLYPPCWMAGPVELLCGQGGRESLALTALAVTIPALGLVCVARFLSPGFHRALSRMDAAETQQQGRVRDRGASSSLRTLGRRVCRRAEEKAAYDLTWDIAGRDRSFRLRVFPTLAMGFIFGLVMLLGPRNAGEAFEQLAHGKMFLLPLYMCSSFLGMIAMHIRYSDQYEAAWVYFALPVEKPGIVARGAFKAVITRYAVPAFLIFAALLVWLRGPDCVDDIALAACVTLLSGLVHDYFHGRVFPFSEKLKAMQQSGRMVKTMGAMYLLMAFGGIHYLLTRVPGGICVGIALVALCDWWLLRAYERIGWPAMKRLMA